MKRHFTDQQIQQMLDDGLPFVDASSVANTSEVQLYRQVFDELKQTLPIQAAPNFSAQVLSQLEVHRPTATDTIVYGWLALGLMICLLVGAFVLTPFDGEATDLLKGLVSVKPFKGILLFSIGSLLVYHFLDWKLVREPSLSTMI